MCLKQTNLQHNRQSENLWKLGGVRTPSTCSEKAVFLNVASLFDEDEKKDKTFLRAEERERERYNIIRKTRMRVRSRIRRRVNSTFHV